MTRTDFKTRFLPLHKELYRVALRMLGESNEAEDAVQNLYLRLWERKDELKDFAECGLCGTAAVISPVGKIVDHGTEIATKLTAAVC